MVSRGKQNASVLPSLVSLEALRWLCSGSRCDRFLRTNVDVVEG